MQTILLASTACLVGTLAWPHLSESNNVAPEVVVVTKPSAQRPPPSPPPQRDPNIVAAPEPLVQVALLLDVSGSMDGLIHQARTQLWEMVNVIGSMQRNERVPRLEIALYAYGNIGYAEDGYIQLLQPFTTDLDRVSESLFALQTNGSEEFCGQAMERAAVELGWSDREDALKIMYIAGNESFHQGPVAPQHALAVARERKIHVNTLYCGEGSPEEVLAWKDAALHGNGAFAAIDHNQAIQRIDAPQDEEILRLGQALNDTYVGYGQKGRASKQRQATQDGHAHSSGAGVQRSLAKKSAMYQKNDWDLVDAVEAERIDLGAIPAAELPEELAELSTSEIKSKLKAKKDDRKKITQRLQELEKAREDYVKQERAKQEAPETKRFDQALLDQLQAQANEIGLEADKSK